MHWSARFSGQADGLHGYIWLQFGYVRPEFGHVVRHRVQVGVEQIRVDPEADSEAVVGLTGPARTAWIDAVGHARRLDELAVLLVAAAELCCTVIVRDEELVPLLVRNAADLHRRKLWAAFLSASAEAQRKPVVSKRELAAQWAPPRCADAGRPWQLWALSSAPPTSTSSNR